MEGPQPAGCGPSFLALHVCSDERPSWRALVTLFADELARHGLVVPPVRFNSGACIEVDSCAAACTCLALSYHASSFSLRGAQIAATRLFPSIVARSTMARPRERSQGGHRRRWRRACGRASSGGLRASGSTSSLQCRRSRNRKDREAQRRQLSQWENEKRATSGLSSRPLRDVCKIKNVEIERETFTLKLK